MAEHPVPERLLSAVIADLRSRVAEMGRDRSEGIDEALLILRALPEIDDETELDIEWYAAGGPPAGAAFNLSARSLSLSVSDADGSREIYCCEARFYPEIDRDDFDSWLFYLRGLNAPEVTISVWNPGASGTDGAEDDI
jgi:hypothetical protein